jgi:hypothetical protein
MVRSESRTVGEVGLPTAVLQGNLRAGAAPRAASGADRDRDFTVKWSNGFTFYFTCKIYVKCKFYGFWEHFAFTFYVLHFTFYVK